MGYQWNVVTYDVWGNEDEGFEVNDSHGAGHIELEDEEQFDDEILLQKLTEAGFLADVEIDDLAFDGDDAVVYINDAHNGKPLLGLVRDQRW
jgi:hypothetical protein